MEVCVIIPAAGSSERYSKSSESGRSKLDEDLGGRPVLQRTVEVFTKRPEVTGIIVAGPADESRMAEFRQRHADKLGLLGVTICAGGKTHRWETVRNALGHAPGSCTHIAVHDAARPCATAELLDRVFDAASHFAAVIPVVDVPDTVKRVSEEAEAPAEPDPLAAILGDAGKPDASARRVEQTLDRRNLVLVQTPQVFRADLLRRAYAQEDLDSTDDAQLVERLGEPVHTVRGEATNVKITRPGDLRLARAVLGVKPPTERAAHKRF